MKVQISFLGKRNVFLKPENYSGFFVPILLIFEN